MVNAHGVFSAHVTRNLDTKQLNYQPKEWCKADGGLFMVKATHLSVLAAKMGKNQLPQRSFSMAECLQW